MKGITQKLLRFNKTFYVLSGIVALWLAKPILLLLHYVYSCFRQEGVYNILIKAINQLDQVKYFTGVMIHFVSAIYLEWAHYARGRQHRGERNAQFDHLARLRSSEGQQWQLHVCQAVRELIDQLTQERLPRRAFQNASPTIQ